MIGQQTCRHLEIVDKDLLMHAFAPPPNKSDFMIQVRTCI